MVDTNHYTDPEGMLDNEYIDDDDNMYANNDWISLNDDNPAIRKDSYSKQIKDQMSIFGWRAEGSNPAGIRNRQLIDLYDMVPRFITSGRTNYGEIVDESELTLTGTAKFGLGYGQTTIQYSMTAGRQVSVIDKIDENGKKYKARVIERRYPSLREERIEEAILAMAANPNLIANHNGFGIKTSISEIHAFLKEHNNGKQVYNYLEIKQTLQILNTSNLSLIDNDGNLLASSAYFPVLSCKDWNNPETKAEIFIQFHPFISRKIRELGYRTISYTTTLKLTTVAKYIYKQIIGYNKKITSDEKYYITDYEILKTLRRYKEKNYKNVQIMESAIQELVDAGLVEPYERNSDLKRIKSPNDGITRNHFYLMLTKEFREQCIRSLGSIKYRNKRMSELTE